MYFFLICSGSMSPIGVGPLFHPQPGGRVVLQPSLPPTSRPLLVSKLPLSNGDWMSPAYVCVRAVRDTVQCQGGLWLDGCQSCCRPDEKRRKRLLDLSGLSCLCLCLTLAPARRPNPAFDWDRASMQVNGCRRSATPPPPSRLCSTETSELQYVL